MKLQPFTCDLATDAMPHPSMIDEMSQAITDEVCAAMASTRGLRLAQLTEKQKYAIAVTAGCPLSPKDMSHDAFRMTFATIPCKIEETTDGGWVVGWQDDYGRLVVNGVRLCEQGVTP